MPKYRVTSPDGKTFEVSAPDGATQEEVIAYAQQHFAGQQKTPTPRKQDPDEIEAARTLMGYRELMSSPPMALGRGLKDIVDTGAQLLAAGYDKLRGPTQSSLIAGGEADRVRAMNAAGRADFASATQGQVMPQIGRAVGNIIGTAPAVSGLGSLVGKALPGLGSAITTGGATTGAVMPTAAQIGARGAGIARAADVGVRSLGGAAGGALAAGMVDPESAGTGAMIGGALPVAGAVLRGAAGAGRELLGAHSGVGGAALGKAYQAGAKGGAASEQLLANMRGTAPMDDALTMAKSNLEAMRTARQAAYRSGMVDVTADKTVLDLAGVRKAVNDASASVRFEGVAKDPRAAKAIDEVNKIVQKWAIRQPERFHTPEGLDALKQQVGSVLESLPFEQKNARRVVGSVYDAVKREIEQQAPSYSKVMRDYSQASTQLSEIERTLLGGQRGSADTAMRKLQSLMRNNANANYGYRDQLAQQMIQQGGNDFTNALAGQALQSWTPRGIQRATAGGGAATLAAFGQLPQAAGLALTSSPRVLGEAAHIAGLLGAKVSPELIYRTLPLLAAERE